MQENSEGDTDFDIDATTLSSGIYHAKLQEGTALLWNNKLVIKK